MKTELISTRIEHELKIEFTQVCDELGLSPSQAIKLFAKAVINHGGIPFELKINKPNKITKKAIQEVEEGRLNQAKSTESLFNDLGTQLKNAWCLYTNQFKKGFKKIKKLPFEDIKLIFDVISALEHELKLDEKFKDHALIGNYVGYRECHINPDLLLIYKTNQQSLMLTRLGSHSDLFWIA